MKRGDWMQTYAGRIFYPMDPDPAEIDIIDIAHSLSMQCRYAGHCAMFYSVAEHSVHVSRYAPRELALWGLLHDASEAYLVDVPRPVKPFLSGYADAEARVMDAICMRFGLDPVEPPEIKRIDNAILADEKSQVMQSCSRPWNLKEPALGVQIFGWSPHIAKREFLHRFKELTYDQP